MPLPTPVAQLVRGFAMGSADIVPGVSGGTVALVLGIYERLIRNIHIGAESLKLVLQGRLSEFVPTLRRVEWVWLLSLLGGVLIAIASLSSVLEGLLRDHPIEMAGLFFGLVAGSLVMAWRLVGRWAPPDLGVMALTAIALFFLLGLRSNTEVSDDAAEVVTRSPLVFLAAGALAICAMILPGISGSFILVMIGMYTEVLGAVNDRNLAALSATVVGCVLGLAVFSSLLNWALERHHDRMMAAMIGLMLGSLRVLWPWPGGTNTTDLAAPSDPVGTPVLLAVIGFVVVLAVEWIASRLSHDADMADPARVA